MLVQKMDNQLNIRLRMTEFIKQKIYLPACEIGMLELSLDIEQALQKVV